MKYDVVLEGGGVKIPGLVGALTSIEANGFVPNGLAGTSAGAIVAAMRAAGYTPSEMSDILLGVDFKQFKDGAPWGSKAYHLMRHKGIYKGDAFLRMMRGFMKDKGVKYFGDLRTTNGSSYPYSLRVFTADVSNGQLVQLPDDMAKYGYDPDKVEIAWAVRCSMSIPYFFRPVKLNGTYLVDGGLLSNFPIWTFDSEGSPRWPTFGVMLLEDDSEKAHKIKGPISFLGAMFQTVLAAHDRRFILPGDYENRVIRVPVGSTSATDFDITKKEREVLLTNGIKEAGTFLTDWTWQGYVDWANEARGINEDGLR